MPVRCATRKRATLQTKLIVPFPPGGSTDFTARILAERLEAACGHSVVVETEVGDNGMQALRSLMQGPADRLFLVGNINANSVMPVVRDREMDFDYLKEVAPISRLAEFPSVIMTQTAFPADTLEDLLRHLKTTSGRIRYCTDFLGTYVDYDALMLGRAAGVNVTCVTASGAIRILHELRAGNCDLAMLNVATATANRGQFKPLAVTGSSRLKNFPDVPTLAEAGFPAIGTSNWQGMFASGEASGRIRKSVFDAVVSVMNEPEVREAFAEIDARAVTSSSPDEFTREIKLEMRVWREALPAILAVPQVDAANRGQ